MWNSEQQNVRVATVGISVSIKGEISGAEDLTVDGQVEGRIDLPQHSLTIGPNATAVADINAKNITVFGAVVGSIVAREKADIRTVGLGRGHTHLRPSCRRRAPSLPLRSKRRTGRQAANRAKAQEAA